MSDVKRCVQCGLLKEADAFRKYTYSRENNTEGRYRVCKKCEAINAAYRRAKQWIADNGRHCNAATFKKMQEIVDKTDKLYSVLEGRGFRVPTAYGESGPLDAIDSVLSFYKEDIVIQPAEVAPSQIPSELIYWLEANTSEWEERCLAPEYLQETVYESLKAKYRPQIGVDKQTYLPIYDDTYKNVLNQILRRFDDYEEAYSLNDTLEE